ncbi:MAG: lytic transglycosylase domain-containing protein [Ignavibacteriaceae bacterium]
MENQPEKKEVRSKIFIFALGVTAVFAFFIIAGISKLQDTKSKIFTGNTIESLKITSPEIPSELNFAGEKVPLNNFEVKERIDRELIVNTYWFSSTILGMKRANRWFPVIVPILKKYKVPEDFKYLPLIESNLSNTTSYAGAVGFWQFTEEPAKKYGLEINDEVDERYNVEKSTEAACKYLLDAYSELNSWTLAAASYNMGLNGINKLILKEKADNYYNLLLSEETSRYVARILAMKIIFSDPHKYGYYLEPGDFYPPLKTTDVTIDSSIDNWADYAISHGINYKTLKYYNPWLRDISLKNKNNETYILKMPVSANDGVIPNGN